MIESPTVLSLDLDRAYQCKATPLYLYDKPLQWVCSVKYLGVTLMSAKTRSSATAERQRVSYTRLVFLGSLTDRALH